MIAAARVAAARLDRAARRSCRRPASPTSRSPTARPGPRSTPRTRCCRSAPGSPVQAAVEGIGVPVAIGISGVLILVLQRPAVRPRRRRSSSRRSSAPSGRGAALLLYRAYGPALVRALERRPLLSPTAELEATPEDEAAGGRAARERDARDDPARVRPAGHDVVAGDWRAELAGLAGQPAPGGPDVRARRARGAGRRTGPATARGGGARERRLEPTPASGCARRGRSRRSTLPTGRQPPTSWRTRTSTSGARRSTRSRPATASRSRRCSPALGDARSADAAAGAVGRLGDAVVPALAEPLDERDRRLPVLALRLVRAATTAVARARPGPRPARRASRSGARAWRSWSGSSPTEPALPDDGGAARRGARATTFGTPPGSWRSPAAIDGDRDGARPSDGPLRRALADELDLMRARVRANRLARHGWTRLGPALVELGAGGPRGCAGRRGARGRAEPRRIEAGPPALRPRALRRRAVAASCPSGRQSPAGPTDVVGWLQDLVEDADGHWSSAWLRACAIHAARGRDALDRMRLDAARALGDPIVDEALASP